MDSVQRNRLLLGIGAMIVLITPVAVYAASFLDIRLASVKTSADKVDKLSLVTEAAIPKDGSSGAFGYGVLTGEGESLTVIVTTTHKGVLDSAAQSGAEDPVFHNHYVKLGNDARCGNNPSVADLTFESPGKVAVGGHAVKLSDLPKTSEDISQSSDVGNVVSFRLAASEPPGATCVILTDQVEPHIT